MNLAMIRIGHGYDVHRFSDVFPRRQTSEAVRPGTSQNSGVFWLTPMAMWCYTQFAMPSWVVSVVAI
jgi:hypothetical protein